MGTLKNCWRGRIVSEDCEHRKEHHMNRAWRVLLICLILTVSGVSTSGYQVMTDPVKARLVYDDVRNFLRAYKLMQSGVEPAEAYAKEYFEKATPGLKALAERKQLSPQSLAEAIRRRPAYYASLKDILDRLSGQEVAVRRALKGFKRVYPDVVYPPVYFMIGDLRAGGLADQSGILIPAEVYVLTPSVDMHEFPNGLDFLHTINDIPHLVAHELAHYQQARVQGIEKYRAIYGESSSLLAIAIREGSADFLAYLASGNHISQRAHEYGVAHEKELWRLFKTQMHNNKTGDWLFVKPSNPELPQDLGYFMGFKITESYYYNARDKKKAILDILSVTDYPAFLEQSGYAKKFSAK